jgi:ceramide glucosyltransferase
MLTALLLLASFGLLTSTVFTGMVAVGALRFLRERRRKEAALPVAYAPPVSLLKPLHGAELGLRENLISFFEQDYAGEFEILFCARSLDDVGLAVAREVAAEYPDVKVRVLEVEGTLYVNAKVSSLERMGAVAAHDIFIISDSDVRVTPSYIREVISDFNDPQVGAVTCLYRGVAEQGVWAKLEAAGMSVEMTSGVMAANLVETMQFLLGPTMAVRRLAVGRMGGFARLGPYCSDDYLLGNWIAAIGYKVVLSSHVIDHIVLNLSFLTSMKHQIRWMKSTRFSRPKGHFGTGLTFSVPFGLLALVAGLVSGHSVLGAWMFLYSILLRILAALLVAGPVVQDRAVARTALLYPLRDLMGFVFWALSYTSDTILWRGRVYRLGENGIMESAHK